jgi:hypothetical protein
MTIEMTADAERYLVNGWAAHVSDPFGELRWIDGDSAALVLPLDIPTARDLMFSWAARTRHLQPPETATFALMLNGRETFRFTPDTEQPSMFSFTIPANDNLLIRGFNRITFERRSGTPPIGIYRISIK